MLIRKSLLAAAILLPAASFADGFGLGAHVGTNGPGLDAFYRISDRLVLRAGYNQYDLDVDRSEDDVEYDGTYAFKNAQLGLDFYPFAGGFRVSAAYVANGNELDLHAVPTGGTFSFNNVEYQGTEVKDAKANISYPGSAAYVGVGWGNPVREGKGFGATFDLGVVYVGSADVALNVECGAVVAPHTCAGLKADGEVERQQLEDDLADVPFWPVVQLGLSYNF
ncbi:MAG TPA: hypothetical protein VF050_04130 [Moraxellaceae bacterium]